MTQIGYGGDDPTNVGSFATNLVGFYGKTPVDQPAVIATATDTTTAIARVNSVIAALQELGLIASA